MKASLAGSTCRISILRTPDTLIGAWHPLCAWVNEPMQAVELNYRDDDPLSSSTVFLVVLAVFRPICSRDTKDKDRIMPQVKPDSGPALVT